MFDNLVLISVVAQGSNYTIDHLRYLVRKGYVQGKKQGGIWLIDPDDLKRYEQEMAVLGTKKFTPKDKMT